MVIDPLLLLAAVVPVCHIYQKPDMFIVVATRGYHSGFDISFNVSKVVNWGGIQFLI